MKQSDRLSPRTVTGTAFVALLSPLIRRFPRTLAAEAGRSACLAPLFALIPLAALAGIAGLLRRRGRESLAFGEILTLGFGKTAGKLLTGLCGLWFVAYGGFLLRSGADRFISTVYYGARPALFVLVMAGVCALAASGSTKAVFRAAMLLRPFLAGVLLLIFLLTLKDPDPGLLLPVQPEARGSITAAAEIVNLLAVGLLFAFSGEKTEPPTRLRHWLRPVLGLLAVLLWMSLSCLAMFGPELTAKMRFPFFMLVRDLSVLGSLERLEPVVVAVWVFCDFVLVSLLLRIGTNNLRFCAGRPAPERCGGVLPLMCAAAAAAVALLIPGDMAAFDRLSEVLVPRLSAGFHIGLPLLTALVLALRKKL